jgi:NAD(P)-dependent dehydrogenase (short-subunit alcohol dehydrogenase family)
MTTQHAGSAARSPKRVLVTGSASGIGSQTAKMLVAGGHEVIVHARNEDRAAAALRDVPGAAAAVVGDLASLDETVALADAANRHGPFDAVIHNAGIYVSGARERPVTADGLEQTFQVNVLAPYVLTGLIWLPRRLIYLSSGMATGGHIVIDDLQRERRPWSGSAAYSDSKLCDLAFAMAAARRYPGTTATAVGPGWVRTRMGGSGAPIDVRTGAATQVWLASSDEPEALTSGRFIRHMRELPVPSEAADVELQEQLLAACEALSGVALPPI